MNSTTISPGNRAITLNRIAVYLCYLIAIALSIKSLREPDLWWQIRTGEWILQNHQVPHSDMFSYTYNGTPWINIKWGFEVVAALIAKMFGAESVFILQAVVSCAIVFLLIKLAKIFSSAIGRTRLDEEKELQRTPFIPKGNRAQDPLGKEGAWKEVDDGEAIFYFSLFIAFLFTFIAVEYRFNGRPEMVSHLLSVAFVFLLMNHRENPSRKIFLLIPLQLIWANFHEAFGMGIVILIVFTVAAWIEKYMAGRKIISSEKFNALQLSGITIAAIAVVCINPNGIELLTRPFNILNQVYQNKFTTELLSFSAHQYWKKEAYIGIGIFICAIVWILFSAMRKEKSEDKNQKSEARSQKPETRSQKPIASRIIEKHGLGYIVLLFAFFYLALTAYRNIIFLVLLSFPAFVGSIVQYNHWRKRKFEKRLPKLSHFKLNYGALITAAIFYMLIVSNKYYTLTKSRDRFGMEVLSTFNPTGAADYISKKHLQEKKCFSDYLTSSYLLWKLQPGFKTFIDLRDLDVFPPEFFKTFIEAANSAYAFHKLDSAYHFDYVVLYRPQFSNLHHYLYNDSVFALTYVDAVAAVYEKTDSFTRDDIFSKCSAIPSAGFANTVNKILNPFYDAKDYLQTDFDYIAASYYLQVGRNNLALQRAEKTASGKKESYKGKEMLGQVYYRMSQADTANQQQLLSMAEENFRQLVKEKDGYAAAYYGLGAIKFQEKNFKAAINYFEKCLKYDDENVDAYIACAESYKNLIESNPSHEKEYLEKMLLLFLNAEGLSNGDDHMTANIGFIYFRLGDCGNAIKYLSIIVNSEALNEGDKKSAKQCLKNCGK